MIGQPFDGQAHGGGFVYEGDHRGGIIRTAGPGDGGSDLPPFTADALMVTNHNMVRGCDEPYGGADGAVRARIAPFRQPVAEATCPGPGPGPGPGRGVR